MGLVSEATAVELGIQSKEDGEARVGIMPMKKAMRMNAVKKLGNSLQNTRESRTS